MRTRTHGRLIGLLLAGAALASNLAFVPPAEAKVGVTSSTSNQPIGIPPAKPQRILQVGVDVFADERIQTTANDRVQLLFLDGSALTVGPNSDLVIDKFVYDPAIGTGSLAVSASKGIFRLVGGKITKEGEAVIKVRGTTIGVRGGIAIINAPEGQPIQSYLMFGKQMSVSSPGGTSLAVRPGSMITSAGGGQAPSGPVLVPPGALAGPISQLEAPAGTGTQTGTTPTGATPGTAAPTPAQIEQSVSTSQLPATNSSSDPVAVAPVVTPTNDAAQVADSTTGAGGDTTTGSDVVDDNPPPPPPPITILSVEGRFLRENPYTSFNNTTLAAPRDPANNTVMTSVTVTGNVLTATSASGPTFTLPWNPGAGVFEVTTLNSSSSLGPLSGWGFNSPTGNAYFYILEETANANNVVGFFGGDLTPTANFPTTGFGAHQVVALPTLPPMLSGDDLSIPVIGSATPGLMLHAYSPVLDNAAALLSASRSVYLQATLNISGQGGAQSSFMQINLGAFFSDETKTNQLYTGGSSNSFLRPSAVSHTTRYTTSTSSFETTNGTSIYGPTGEYIVLGPENVVTNAGVTTRTPQAGLEQPFNNLTGSDYYWATVYEPVALPAGIGTLRTSRTLTGFAAALVDKQVAGPTFSTYTLLNTDPVGVSITTDPATNRAVGSFSLFNPSNSENMTLQWGSIAGISRSTSAFIDDKNFGMRQSPSVGSTYDGANPLNARIDMVTQATVPDSDWLPGGVSFCTCAYMTWGYWQGDIRYDSGPRTGQRDRVHLGTWVAGVEPLNVDLPGSGSATYVGHVVGNVENNFNKYVAAGTYSNNWNFGTRTGTLAITNFDSTDYTGTTTGSPGTPKFSGAFTDNSSRSGTLNGTFFRSPTDAAAYQAGSFSIGGTNYKAVGTFAGQR